MSGRVVRKWENRESVKDYGPSGKEDWTTYRWQLEAFVEKIRAGKPEVWVSGEESTKQMKALDMIYEKAGLPLSSTTEYPKK